MTSTASTPYTDGVLAATTKYALKALFLLAEKPKGELVPVEQVSKESGVPAAYLSKIMKALAEEGIIQGRKGAKGGVCLKPRSKPLTVYDVCLAVRDPIAGAECMLNYGPCNRANPCRLHHEWKKVVAQTQEFLKSSVISK